MVAMGHIPRDIHMELDVEIDAYVNVVVAYKDLVALALW